MMELNIGEMVVAILDGEIHRYGEIVRHFDDRIRRVIGSRVHSDSITEDLVQETFYRAFTNLHHLRDPDQLASWLQTIAKNCVRDYFRKSIRQQQNDLAYQQQASGKEPLLFPDDNSWVWQEVATLPANFAEVLKLRYQQQMSYEEICQATGLPESTVRGRIFEARKSLKQKLIDKRLFP